MPYLILTTSFSSKLKVGLAALYHTWAAADPLFAEVAEKYPGVRILRQDPVENVFSFICSANNHISRISSMVERLCTEWGESLAWYEGKEYFAFPAIEKLAEEGVEARLRELGFGYRAKYIQQSAARFNQQIKSDRNTINDIFTLCACHNILT